MPVALVVDWTQLPTYNTIMSVAAGAALMSLVYFFRALQREKDIHLDSWAMAFAVPGFILLATGLHMTLTWPLAKYFPYDNIIFGEPCLAFGTLLLAAALYLWKREGSITAGGDAARHIAHATRPISVFVVGMGLSLIGVAMAGLTFQLFAAPPEEPISGLLSGYPWIEATFISGLYGLVGIGAVLLPFAMRGFHAASPPTAVQRIVGFVWWVTGLAFLLFGALNFFIHVGLVLHTMPKP